MKLSSISGWTLLAVSVAFSSAAHADSSMQPVMIDEGGSSAPIVTEKAVEKKDEQKKIDPALGFDESVEILGDLSGMKVVVVRQDGGTFIGSLQVKDKSIEITTRSPHQLGVEFLVYLGGDAWWWGVRSENEKTEAMRHFDELMTPERIRALQDHVSGQLSSNPFVLLRAPAKVAKPTSRSYMVDFSAGEYTLVME